MASSIAAITTGTGGIQQTADASGNLNLVSGTTTIVAMTSAGIAVTGTLTNTTGATFATSSGNVGIGTSSPSAVLHLNKASGSADMRLSVGGTLYANIYASSSDTSIFSVAATPLLFGTNNTERMRIDSSGNLLFNSGYGSVATAYGCRAWVNFNGTGTVAIRASGNVSSITDNGTGDYTVNFTTAMPDANYNFNLSTVSVGGPNKGASYQHETYPQAAGSCRLLTLSSSSGSATDISVICATFFR